MITQADTADAVRRSLDLQPVEGWSQASRFQLRRAESC